MTVEVAFEVFLISLLVLILIDFLWLINFRASLSGQFLISDVGALFFLTKRGRELKRVRFFRCTIQNTVRKYSGSYSDTHPWL